MLSAHEYRMDKEKKQLIEKLKKTYCRIYPSKIAGVGVVAVRDIPKGIDPFDGIRKQRWIELDVKDLKDLEPGVMKMVEDFFVVEKNGKVLVAEDGLNGMDISFFINNSDRPNVYTPDGGFTFVTLRAIKKGEELTVSYATYAEE